MDDLIKALQILLKYGNPARPTLCESGVLYVLVDPEVVSDEDTAALEKLSFTAPLDGAAYFRSYRFGDPRGPRRRR